jgi:hypothetical protein
MWNLFQWFSLRMCLFTGDSCPVGKIWGYDAWWDGWGCKNEASAEICWNVASGVTSPNLPYPPAMKWILSANLVQHPMNSNPLCNLHPGPRNRLYCMYCGIQCKSQGWIYTCKATCTGNHPFLPTSTTIYTNFPTKPTPHLTSLPASLRHLAILRFSLANPCLISLILIVYWCTHTQWVCLKSLQCYCPIHLMPNSCKSM